jgi:Flp pilus assembly protein TadG
MSAGMRGGLGRRGMAAVEFAIAASFLAVAMAGVYDFGRASWTRMQVVSAAHVGAAFAAAHGFNASLIASAVTSSSALGTLAATPAPATVCGCPNGSAGIGFVECGSACADGAGASTYVRVNARATYSFTFSYPYVSNPLVMTATALSRIQ